MNDRDTELLSTVAGYDETNAQYDAIANDCDEDVRLGTLAETCAELAYRITAMPACTRAGLEAKRRIIEQTGLTGDAAGNPPAGDLRELVETILALDAERIQAKRRG